MSEKKTEPFDRDTLERINDLLCGDIKTLPREYERFKVYATYHRIWHLLLDNGKQAPQVDPDEIESMKFYRNNHFSYEDVAYIMRRSPASVHHHLKDMMLGEWLDRHTKPETEG